jgi:hypothetical protein
MDAPPAGLLIALMRCGIGVTGLVRPRLLVRVWTGDDAGSADVQVLSRALAGRDLAIGLGALSAAGNMVAARTWIRAGGFADAVDALGTLAICKHLTPGRRLVLPAVAALSAAVSWRVAR